MRVDLRGVQGAYHAGVPVVSFANGGAQFWEQAAPSEYLDPSSLVLFSGHSLVDAIFSGESDWRPVMTTYHPQAPGHWRRVTIPGSTLEIRWDWRNGAENEASPDPMPAPFDPSNGNSPVIPTRDLAAFDAVLITEGGPFSPPLKADNFNAQWNGTDDYFGRWRDLIGPKPIYFWTIWPAITVDDQESAISLWKLDETDRTDIPPFLAFLDRYRRVAEEWCSKDGQRVAKIIPGHLLMEVLYRRYHEETPTLPGTWADLWADDIHPNFLGAVFTSVMAYRWMFGAFPDEGIVNARLAQAETNQGITAAHVFEVVSATLGYVQGNGTDLQIGTFVPPTPLWDVQNTAASPGVNVIGEFVPGEVLGPNNGVWWDLAEEPDEMFALLRVSHTAANASDVPIYAGSNPQWNVWDAKIFGLHMNVSNDGEGGRLAVLEGSGLMAAALDLMGGVGNSRLLEVYIGPKGKRVRLVDNPSQWLGNYEPRSARALPTTKLGVNVEWNNDAMALSVGNFAIHAGVTYDYIPDDLTRLRLIAMFCEGRIP